MWLVLPLGLLICLAAGGVCMHMKRKHSKKAGNESEEPSPHIAKQCSRGYEETEVMC